MGGGGCFWTPKRTFFRPHLKDDSSKNGGPFLTSKKGVKKVVILGHFGPFLRGVKKFKN